MVREIALRPPRKCALPGEGMVNLGMRVATDFRYWKCSTMIGREQAILPVTLAIGGTSSALNVSPTGRVSSMPSSCFRKSRCQKSRRNSPSVTACRPMASCFLTACAIERSSTAFSPASGSLPEFAAARASCSSFGRSKLPTWSAWNGGREVLVVTMGPPRGPCYLERGFLGASAPDRPVLLAALLHLEAHHGLGIDALYAARLLFGDVTFEGLAEDEQSFGRRAVHDEPAMLEAFLAGR